MKDKRVVVTGLGLVTPMGLGINPYWEKVKLGESGIGTIRSFDTSAMPVSYAGQVKDDQFEAKKYVRNRKQLKRLSRNGLFAMMATNMAIEDARLSIEELDPHRIGVYLGTTYGQRDMEDKIKILLSSESDTEPGTLDTAKYASAFRENVNPVHTLQNITNLVACHIAIAYNCRGPVNTFVTNFVGGAQAIGSACRLIKRGDSDLIFAGGAEALIYPQHLLDCALFLDLSTNSEGNPARACRPFDKNRDGMVLGEGAGIVILESLEHAAKRQAKIYGEVAGYGISAGHINHVQLQRETSLALSMKNALADAGVKASEVDYVNAHGDSTILGDRLETLAIKKVFSGHAYHLPISSTKSMTGHLWSASGPVELITCLLAMGDNIIPPTINYEHPDPHCDLDCVANKAREAEINLVMSNSVGLFGQSASLIISRFFEN
jgi:3-oxoacyl-[acyl-carrier-protein] synthase II